MPRPSKSKQNLQAQAALARCSRSSSNITSQSSTASALSSESSPSAPAVSPTPSLNTPDVIVVGESNDIQKTFENECLHLPDIPEDPEEGYHTNDDLSELEDEELEESLKKQREGESEQVIENLNVFDTLMRGVNQKEWKKAESNRRMGYGSKTAERTEH